MTAAPSDAELLGRFLTERDEESFRCVVERHTGMVYHTCLRALNGNTALSQDATQAVFLILTRKAGSLVARPDLGAWLHKTALYVSQNALRAEMQRKRREAEVAERVQGAPMNDHDPWEEARPHVNDAVAALGTAQQEAVVMCLLEGLSQVEAARRTGCSKQAIQQRVAAGLEKMRRFLRRRGIVLSVAALTAGLNCEAAQACPAHLAVTCSTAALGVANGKVLAGTAGALAQGGMKMMFWGKVKILTAVCAICLVVMSAGIFASLSAGETKPAEKTTKPKEPVGDQANVESKEACSQTVNGLSASIRFKRTRFHPFRTIGVEAFLTNQSSKPIKVMSPRPHKDLWLVKNTSGRVLPYSPLVTARKKGGLFYLKDPVSIPPGHTILLSDTALNLYYDLFRPGEYTVRYAYELSEDGQIGQSGRRIPNPDLKALKEKGTWFGKLETEPFRFTISPKEEYPPASRWRTIETKVVSVDGGHFKVDKGGEIGAEVGTVFFAHDQAGTVTGWYRFNNVGTGYQNRVVPAQSSPPLKVGDVLKARVDDDTWMRSELADKAGSSMNGLRLVLRMDKTELKEGEPWIGTVEARNEGKAPVRFYMGGGNVKANILTVSGERPDIVYCVGRGIGPSEDEIRKSSITLQPGRSRVVWKLNGQEKGQLVGHFGRNYVGWKLGPGTYRLSFDYRYCTKLASWYRADAWMGSIESNVVSVKVVEPLINDF